MVVILSVELELRQVSLALGHVDPIRDIAFEDDDVLEHERVHFGSQQTPVRILRRADDRLARER
jgi:hypothetical protein